MTDKSIPVTYPETFREHTVQLSSIGTELIKVLGTELAEVLSTGIEKLWVKSGISGLFH